MAHRTLMLFDLVAQKWTQAYGSEMGWSIGRTAGSISTFWTITILKRDFATVSSVIRLNDLKIENIVDIKNVGRPTNGTFAA
jgi:hypothetical protein